MNLQENLHKTLQKTPLPNAFEKSQLLSVLDREPEKPFLDPRISKTMPIDITKEELELLGLTQEIPKVSQTIITARIFIREIRKLRLSGKEFLSLLGNSRISNADYQQISRNPNITFVELEQILDNSPLRTDDYLKIISAAQAYVEAREQAAKPVMAATAQSSATPFESKTPADSDTEETIPSTQDQYKTELLEEDKNRGADEQDTALDLNTHIEDMDMLPSSDDEEEKPQKIKNKHIIILCYILAFVLLLGSFGIRYWKTGSLLPFTTPQVAVEKPESYEDVYRLVSLLKHQAADLPLPTIYADPKHSRFDGLSPLVTFENKALYWNADTLLMGDTKTQSFTVAHWYPKDATLVDIFQKESLLYLVFQANPLTKDFSFTRETQQTDENGNRITEEITGTLIKDRVLVYGLDLKNPDKEPNVYLQDGLYQSAIWIQNDLLLQTFFRIDKTPYEEVKESYLPFAGVPGEELPVSYTHIHLSKYAASANATVITRIGNAKQSGAVIYGGLNSFSLTDNNTLYLFQNEQKDALISALDIESMTVLAETAFSGTLITSDSARINKGYLSLVLASSASSYLTLDANLNIVARIDGIGSGESQVEAFLSENTLTVLTDGQGGMAYGIDISDPLRPAPLSQFSPSFTNKQLLPLYDNLYLSVSVKGGAEGVRKGLSLSITDGKQERSAITLTAESSVQGDWNRYLYSPAETNLRSIYLQPDTMVFAFPYCYFNGISQVDRLVFYRFTKDGEVTQLGELVLYDKQLLSKQILPGIMQQGDEYLVFWGDYQYRLSAEELVLKDVKPIIKSSESDGEITSDSAEQ